MFLHLGGKKHSVTTTGMRVRLGPGPMTPGCSRPSTASSSEGWAQGRHPARGPWALGDYKSLSGEKATAFSRALGELVPQQASLNSTGMQELNTEFCSLFNPQLRMRFHWFGGRGARVKGRNTDLRENLDQRLPYTPGQRGSPEPFPCTESRTGQGAILHLRCRLRKQL